MKNHRDFDEEGVPFNQASLLMKRVDKRWDEIDILSAEGNILAWYRLLRTLVRTISFKLTASMNIDFKLKEIKEKDLKACLDLLNKAKESMEGSTSTANRRIDVQLYKIQFHNVENILFELELKLVKLMYESGIYYPKYAHKSFEERWEEVYK
jgi:hypothetical protein|tara:strand:+ start:1163 stop:1621 length:459 start_codon:yes stop_codon:yes gene_type:complete